MAYRILIVDDEPILTELLSTHLQDHGYTVSVANSSKESETNEANVTTAEKVNSPGLPAKAGCPGVG